MIKAKSLLPIHYWRYVKKHESNFGDYEVHGAWCGVDQFHSNQMTSVLENVTCERCKNTTKFQEDWRRKHGKKG